MITRREFIKSSSLMGGAMFLSSCSTAKVKNANSKFNVAFVGTGGIGGQAFRNLDGKSDVNIVALCDVDDARAAANYKEHSGIPRFRDFRVMLDKMDGDIDGVIVNTPDHMHYPVSAWAIAKGKHVFCQKPLTRTVWEARRLNELAADAGVFTQMGNQGHTSDGWRTIREWSDAGVIGLIEDVYIWTDRPAAFWKQGINVNRPPAEPVPSTLDYGLWLGVAPYQPYNHAFIPHDWRGVRSYGTGAIGDMGCHFLDVPYSAFDLGFPTKVSAFCEPSNDYSWPSASTIEMEFDNPRGAGGKIRLHWYDGYRRPKEIKRVDDAFLKDPRNKNCTFIVGEKETVKTNEYGVGTTIYPHARMVELKKANALPDRKIERSVAPLNPHLEWAKCALDGKNPPGNFSYAAPFTEMALLGMIAVALPGRELEYNPAAMAFKNCPEADKYVRSLYAYRREFLAAQDAS